MANSKKFDSNGFLLLKGYLPRDSAVRIAEKVLSYLEGGSAINVDRANSKFLTFNGSDVDNALPELSKLYDDTIMRIVNDLCSRRLVTLENRAIGLSVNATPKDGKFVPHFDRNLVTAVLYLNDDFTGGEMILYPRVRFVLKGRYRPGVRSIQHALDKIVTSRLYLKNIAKRIVVKPSPGDLLVFEGSRSLHGVEAVDGRGYRFSVQFAYDVDRAHFDTSDYYGNRGSMTSVDR